MIMPCEDINTTQDITHPTPLCANFIQCVSGMSAAFLRTRIKAIKAECERKVKDGWIRSLGYSGMSGFPLSISPIHFPFFPFPASSICALDDPEARQVRKECETLLGRDQDWRAQAAAKMH